MAGNPHVLSVGVDLVPALESQGLDAEAIVESVAQACRRHGGQAPVPAAAAKAMKAVSKVLNIAWIADALESAGERHLPAQHRLPANTDLRGDEDAPRGPPRSARYARKYSSRNLANSAIWSPGDIGARIAA